MGQRGSFSDYATHSGTSPAYVSKLKKQGRLVLVKDDAGKVVVDFDLSDRLVRNTADLSRAGNGANAKPHAAPSAPSQPDTPISGQLRNDAAFRQAHTHEKVYAAKKAELEYKKLAGELVERKRVEDAAYTIGRMMRDSVLSVPTRLAPELADISDAWEIEQRIAAALRRVLDDVSKLAEADLERAMAA